MLVTDTEKSRTLNGRQLIGSAVAAALFEEGERAIVDDEVFAEKFRRGAKTFGEQAPEPFAADLATMAFESGDGPFRMLVRRTIDFRFDAKPITHRSDLAKRYAGLCHAERPGIHSEKQNALRSFAVAPEIQFMGTPGVAQWVVSVRDRRGESQFVDPIAEATGCGNQRFAHRGHPAYFDFK